MSFHTKMQSLQTEIYIERILGRLDGSQVSHQLCGCFGDVCGLSEFLGIGNSVIGLVRSGQSGVFVGIFIPVKITGIHDTSADCCCMSVHVFGGGMGNDVHTVFKRFAVNRGREGIVHDYRNTCFVSNLYELVKIKNRK